MYAPTLGASMIVLLNPKIVTVFTQKAKNFIENEEIRAYLNNLTKRLNIPDN